MPMPHAHLCFELTLRERVDLAVRASRQMLGHRLWRLPIAAALLGSLVVVAGVTVTEPDLPTTTAWGAGAITLAILAVLLPPIVLLWPRIVLRAALQRTRGSAPLSVTVTLTDDEITTRDPVAGMSMSWASVELVDAERDGVYITSRVATFFVPGRAFTDAAAQSAFIDLAQRLASTARAVAATGAPSNEPSSR